VNLAARLQGEAAAGEIVLSEAVHERLRSRPATTSVNVTVKGIDRPVPAHVLSALAPIES